MNPLPSTGRIGLFIKIGDYAARRKGFIFIMTALLVFLAVGLGSQIRLDTNVLDMVPRGNIKVEAFKDSLKDFGSIDYLMVLIEAPEGKTAEEYHEFVDAFANRLLALPDVLTVEYRLGANDQLLELFRKYALLLLPPESLPDLERKLSREGIREAMVENRRILASPASALLKQLPLHSAESTRPRSTWHRMTANDSGAGWISLVSFVASRRNSIVPTGETSGSGTRRVSIETPKARRSTSRA